MSGEEAAHLAKAHRMLAQANALSAQEAPESAIHLAYYAMFHAATAILLRHRAGLALTHTGLIGAFGRFAAGRGEIGRAQGRALNRAEDLRLRADYGVVYGDLPEAAAAIRRDAGAFLAFCESVVAESSR